MIIVKVPLRISFVGGGTDLPDFYRQHPGRVISATIDKFVYLVISQSYNMDDFILKYQITERVKRPEDFVHNRFRTALLEYGITTGGIEVGSFADIPAKTGLGSSSSFTVALVKGLQAFIGKDISGKDLAEEAARLEICLLNEPIGKQDQYAAALGGFNVFQFNADGSVDCEPVNLDEEIKKDFEDHLLLFFTGLTRDASSVLHDQKSAISGNLETYKSMTDSVDGFRDKLQAGDFRALAGILHEGWQRKKSLSANISNPLIDQLYASGIEAGAWGGKILGAGGGGCLLFIAPPAKHAAICQALSDNLSAAGQEGFKEIPFSFTQDGSVMNKL